MNVAESKFRPDFWGPRAGGNQHEEPLREQDDVLRPLSLSIDVVENSSGLRLWRRAPRAAVAVTVLAGLVLVVSQIASRGASYSRVSRGWNFLSADATLMPGEEKLLVLAKMSALAYNLAYQAHISGDLGGTGYLEDVRQQGYEVQQEDCLHEPNNTKALDGATFVPSIAVFTKEVPRQAVIAIKGTTLGSTVNRTSVADVEEIFKIFLEGDYPKEGEQRVKRIVDKYTQRGYAVIVTGHSLGGYLAEVASTHFNLPGVGFCAPGPNNPVTQTYHDGPISNPYYHTINAQHDVIGNYEEGLRNHKQWTIYVKGTFHLPGTLISALQRVPDIASMTNVNVRNYIRTRLPTFQYYLPDPVSKY